MCIDIVEIWFGIAYGLFRQILTEVFTRDMPIFLILEDNLSKCRGIRPNLVHALILRRSGLGLLIGKFRQFLTELSAHKTIMAGYYSHFMFLFKAKNIIYRISR